MSLKRFGGRKAKPLCSIKIVGKDDAEYSFSLGKKASSTMARIMFCQKIVLETDKETFKGRGNKYNT